ncbi:hypothetical protein TREAZ_1926 [Leadbettera azotonutricia ZAS-9]|uniref:Uncharacterized protein n=1 Tax=Leadbettera azotonutricia (strain ATCC BAA-888 / DSM 13862 / ZAS-9) TaxID=545695 RepID=F5YAS8_LEAAZ|nr:hypothetical protein TREAZ_1926 [Leadbettera azotonutricia ZAS-9]
MCLDKTINQSLRTLKYRTILSKFVKHYGFFKNILVKG